jgi:hypothetical protein
MEYAFCDVTVKGYTDRVELVLKQAYPVGFSTGDATDFSGIVIARPPRAA